MAYRISLQPLTIACNRTRAHWRAGAPIYNGVGFFCSENGDTVDGSICRGEMRKLIGSATEAAVRILPFRYSTYPSGLKYPNKISIMVGP